MDTTAIERLHLEARTQGRDPSAPKMRQHALRQLAEAIEILRSVDGEWVPGTQHDEDQILESLPIAKFLTRQDFEAAKFSTNLCLGWSHPEYVRVEVRGGEWMLRAETEGGYGDDGRSCRTEFRVVLSTFGHRMGSGS